LSNSIPRPGKRETYNLKMFGSILTVLLVNTFLLTLFSHFRTHTEKPDPNIHKYRCRVCPGHNCILIKQGGKSEIRQICFDFPGEDGYCQWEDITGLQEDDP
jgi:hypothetical protein